VLLLETQIQTNMKQIKIIAITIAVLMTAPFVFAETNTATTGINPEKTRMELLRQKADEIRAKASTTKEKLLEQVKALREKASTTRANLQKEAQTMREKVQDKKVEMKNNFDAKKIAILKRTAENTVRILQEAINRLEKIAVRIDSRITKMEANTIDVTQAKANMVIARQKIADAKTALATAKNVIATIETDAKNASTTPNIMGDSTKKIKEQARLVKDALQSAHSALVQSIKELKGKEGMRKATTTIETTQ